MNPKIKNLLKVFGISIGIVSGACAIIMGGLFLFGAFNKAHVPLDSMHFVVNDVYHETTTSEYDKDTYLIDSDSYILLKSNPEDSTEVDVNIQIIQGDEIVTIPEKYEINQPIKISVTKQELTIGNNKYSVNKGGVVKLYARQDLVECDCTIFVDVALEEFSIKLVDENDNQLYPSEDGKILYYYVEDEINGTYGFNQTSEEYKLLIELPNTYNGKKYIQKQVELYQGSSFYVTIDKFFPTNSLNEYEKLALTKNVKNFNVSSTPAEYAQVSKINNKKFLVTILEPEDFTISAEIINTYNNVVTKQILDDRVANNDPAFSDDDLYTQNYTNVVNAFTKKSNSFNISCNQLAVKGIVADVKEINVSTQDKAITFNSLGKSLDNENGLGITFLTPDNSNYTSKELEFKLNDLKVATGYKTTSSEIMGGVVDYITIDNKNITISNEFLYAKPRVIKTGTSSYTLYLDVEIYNQKISEEYENYIILEVDGYYCLITVFIKKPDIPEFQIKTASTNNEYKLQIDNTDVETMQLSLEDLYLLDNSKLDVSKYNVLYMLWNNTDNCVDIANTTIKNNNGVVGEFEYVVSPNGEFGLVNGEYVPYEDLTGYEGSRYSREFKMGKIVPLKAGIVTIKAFIIKQDYNGTLVNFEQDSSGVYGYYLGRYMLISEIEKLLNASYEGVKYSEGAYKYEQSSQNAITISVEERLRITGTKIIIKDDQNLIDVSELNFDDNDISFVNNELKLYENETRKIYIVLECNNIEKLISAYNNNLLLFKFDEVENGEYISIGSFQQIIGETYGVPISIAKHKDRTIPITINFYENSVLDSPAYNFNLNLNVVSIDLYELSLTGNGLEECTINAQINGNEIIWSDCDFALNYKPSRFELNNSYIKFSYYEVYDELNSSNNVVNNDVLELSFKDNDSNQITATFKKAGIIYVVATYYDGDLLQVSNALKVEVITPNVVVNLIDTVLDDRIVNEETIKVNQQLNINNNEGDYQTIILNNSDWFNLSYLEEVKDLNESLLDFEIEKVFTVNGRDIDNYSTNILIEKDANDNVLLRVNKLLAVETIVKLKISTKFGGDYGTYYIELKPDVLLKKPESSNASIVVDTNTSVSTYSLTVNSGDEVILQDIITITNNADIEYSFTIDNVSISSSSFMSVQEDASGNVKVNFINETLTPVTQQIKVTLEFGYEILINVTINNH